MIIDRVIYNEFCGIGFDLGGVVGRYVGKDWWGEEMKQNKSQVVIIVEGVDDKDSAKLHR